MSSFEAAIFNKIKQGNGDEDVYSLLEWKAANWPHISDDRLILCIHELLDFQIVQLTTKRTLRVITGTHGKQEEDEK